MQSHTYLTVVLYLGHLAADGKAIATIAQARAAISHAHAAQGIPKGDNPARHPAVAEVLKGWRNQALAPKQADALTTDALTRIRETARLPRRGRDSRTETTAMAQARGTVDLAIIGVMADAGLRRSEAAAPAASLFGLTGETLANRLETALFTAMAVNPHFP